MAYLGLVFFLLRGGGLVFRGFWGASGVEGVDGFRVFLEGFGVFFACFRGLGNLGFSLGLRENALNKLEQSRTRV